MKSRSKKDKDRAEKGNTYTLEFVERLPEFDLGQWYNRRHKC